MLQMVLSNQKRTGNTGHMTIGCFEHDLMNYRYQSSETHFLRYHGLRSRFDVVDTVLNLTGVYIFVAAGRKGSGHAFAFDTNDLSSISFFDPNQGEYIFTNETTNDVVAWWERFWEGNGGEQGGTVDYKYMFKYGKTRELHRYSKPRN